MKSFKASKLGLTFLLAAILGLITAQQQEPPQQQPQVLSIEQAQGLIANDRMTMASRGSPLITDVNCQYKWFSEYNIINSMCFDIMGLPSKNQLRFVQNPISQCYVTTNQFLATFRIDDLSRFLLRPTDGSYFCCDIHEPGYGYLFTDCGGHEVIVISDKLGNSQFRDINSQAAQGNQIWNFTELNSLIGAKCEGTYMIGDEFRGGEYDVWATLDIPWQQWMRDQNIRNLEELQAWLNRYYDFLNLYLAQLQQQNQTSLALTVSELINQFSPNMTMNQTLQNIPFVQAFSNWYSQIRTQWILKEPGLASIPPGYRAIVRWIRTRMIRDLHFRLANQINSMDTEQQTNPLFGTERVVDPEMPGNNGQEPGIAYGSTNPGDFGDQEFNDWYAVNTPAITSGGSNQYWNMFNWFRGGVGF